jgi:hypothetical protein
VVDVFQLCEDENTGGWVRRSVDLSNYAGQTIVIDIRSETDGSLYSSLYIDDVSLAASPLGGSAERDWSEMTLPKPKSEATEWPDWFVLPESQRPRLLD